MEDTLMFCMNCGTKLPDDAKFCFKCGTQLGATANREEEKSEKHSNSQGNTIVKTFELGEDLHINFYAEDMDYCKLRKDIELNVAQQQVKFFVEYKKEKISDMTGVLEKAVPLANSLIDDSIDFGVSLLMKWGIDFIDKVQLEKIVMEKAQELPAGKVYQQEMQELVQYANQLEEEHASKEYWSGGGFGVSGAIKGAVKAELMNVGTNALVNLGRALTSNTANDKMKRFKANIYEKVNQEQLFLDLIYQSGGIALFDTIYEILLDYELIAPSVHYDSARATGKYNNISAALQNNKMSCEQASKALCSCIELSPFNVDYALVLNWLNPACFTAVFDMMKFLGMGANFALKNRRYTLDTEKDVVKVIDSNTAVGENRAIAVFSQNDLECVETLYQPLDIKLVLYFASGKYSLDKSWNNIDCFNWASNSEVCEVTVYTDRKPDYKRDLYFVVFEDQKIRISKKIRILFAGRYADELKARNRKAEANRGKGILDADAIQLLAEKSNLEFYSFAIPDTYTHIGQRAFAGYEQLRVLSVPRSINVIENEAFSDCPTLRNVDCLNKKCTLGGQLFRNSPNVIVHCVLDSSMHEYCYENHVPFWTGEKNPYLISNYNLVTNQIFFFEKNKKYEFNLKDGTICYSLWHDRGEYSDHLLNRFEFSVYEIERIEKIKSDKIVFYLKGARKENEAECCFREEKVSDLIKFLYYVAQYNVDIYENIDNLAHAINDREATSCLRLMAIHKREVLEKQLPTYEKREELKKLAEQKEQARKQAQKQAQSKLLLGEEAFKAEKYTEALPILQDVYAQGGPCGGKAALYIGIMCAKGLGVQASVENADTWLCIALDSGDDNTKRIAKDWRASLKNTVLSNRSAQRSDLLSGEKAFKSGKYTEALPLLQNVYAQGGTCGGKAALYIGIMCVKGLGMQASAPNAKAWFNIALDLGDDNTKRIAKDWMSTL